MCISSLVSNKMYRGDIHFLSLVVINAINSIYFPQNFKGSFMAKYTLFLQTYFCKTEIKVEHNYIPN